MVETTPSSSRSSTIAAPPEYHATSPSDSVTNIQDPSKSHHDPNRPDLSFPFQSTKIEEGGFTDEYRTVSRTGYIHADTALRPIPSHTSITPAALRDPEKARELHNKKLVTFVPDDPEDPRNHANWYKWCKYPGPSRERTRC